MWRGHSRPRALTRGENEPGYYLTAENLEGSFWSVTLSYSAQRRKSSAPFVPPKPKELDIAYSKAVFLRWLGT